jgi:hypothetical protein
MVVLVLSSGQVWSCLEGILVGLGTIRDTLTLVQVWNDYLAEVLNLIVTRLGLSSGQVWSCLEGIWGPYEAMLGYLKAILNHAGPSGSV